MPKLDGDEARLVLEVIAIELRAEQKGVRLGTPVLRLNVAEQALDPRCGGLPASEAPVHTESLLAVRLPDKAGRVTPLEQRKEQGDAGRIRRTTEHTWPTTSTD